MGFESNFDEETVQCADIYNFADQGKAKCLDKDTYSVGWNQTGNEYCEKSKRSKAKPKVQKKQENPSWGPMYQNRSNFNDMHCF